MKKKTNKDGMLIRLSNFIDNLLYSQKDLAEMMGVPQQYITKMKKGDLSIEPYINILYNLGLNLNWLYTGKGKMILENDLGIKLVSKAVIEKNSKMYQTINDMQIFNIVNNKIEEYEKYVIYDFYFEKYRTRKMILSSVHKDNLKSLGQVKLDIKNNGVLIMYENDFAKLRYEKTIYIKDEEIRSYKIYDIDENFLLEFSERDSIYNEIEFVVSEIDVYLTELYKKLGLIQF